MFVDQAKTAGIGPRGDDRDMRRGRGARRRSRRWLWLLVVAVGVALVPLSRTAKEPADAQASTVGAYKPLTPKRLVDTSVGGNASMNIQVTGPTSGVPAPAEGTVAVAMNVTVVANGAGWGTVWEQASPSPTRPRRSTTSRARP